MSLLVPVGKILETYLVNKEKKCVLNLCKRKEREGNLS